jgi:hypothetical protein
LGQGRNSECELDLYLFIQLFMAQFLSGEIFICIIIVVAVVIMISVIIVTGIKEVRMKVAKILNLAEAGPVKSL